MTVLQIHAMLFKTRVRDAGTGSTSVHVRSQLLEAWPQSLSLNPFCFLEIFFLLVDVQTATVARHTRSWWACQTWRRCLEGGRRDGRGLQMSHPKALENEKKLHPVTGKRTL